MYTFLRSYSILALCVLGSAFTGGTAFANSPTGATSDSAAAGADEVVFLLKGRGNVFWQIIRKGVEEAAQEHALKAVVLNTDDDQTPEAQLNMCLASLARKPKVVVMAAATRNVGIECFRRAAAQGVQFADIDGNVSVEDARAANLTMAFSVGSNNEQIGEQAAAFAAQALAGRSPKVLVISGLPGSIVSEQRSSGFLRRLRSVLPAATVVGVHAGNWDRMKAMSVTIDSLQREPELTLIFSVSDVMTLGIVEGVRVAQKRDTVMVVSVDGTADARKALLEGRITGIVAQLPYLMGRRAVELALETMKTPLAGKSEFIPTPLLTKDVLTQDGPQNEDSALKFIR